MEVTSILQIIFPSLLSFIGVVITVYFSNKSMRDELLNNLQTANKLEELEIQRIKEDLSNIRKGIKDDMTDSHAAIKQDMEYFASEMVEMKADIKEHNNYAKQLPEIQGKLDVITEKVSVSNKRLDDLEAFQKDITNRMIDKKMNFEL